MVKGLYILSEAVFHRIYGTEEQTELAQMVDFYAPRLSAADVKDNPQVLAEAEVIFSGWGAPLLNRDFLSAAPNLKAFFYGAGSVRSFVTPSFWEGNVLLTSARAGNAVAVAEYAVATILFSLKRGFHFAQVMRQRQGPPESGDRWVPGAFETTVGLISMGSVARVLLEKLRVFDLKVIAYDPYLSASEAARLGIELVSLEEVFRRSEVVSLHTPWLKETERMIRGHHFLAMKRGAAFINTARGAVVHEPEMIAALEARPDLSAVLDVTYPEPPPKGSPLYTLPNVILTPHIAGTMDTECRRMGRLMIEEFQRYAHGEPLHWPVTRENFDLLA